MSKYCPDCGCIRDGGFCTNCHEEVFIVCQASEMGMDISADMHNKANEHINNEERIKLANKERKDDSAKRKAERMEVFGE